MREKESRNTRNKEPLRGEPKAGKSIKALTAFAPSLACPSVAKRQRLASIPRSDFAYAVSPVREFIEVYIYKKADYKTNSKMHNECAMNSLTGLAELLKKLYPALLQKVFSDRRF